MRIIKHGNFLEYICSDCGCKWYASKNESKHISHSATLSPSEWGCNCPDCGKWNIATREVKGDEGSD